MLSDAGGDANDVTDATSAPARAAAGATWDRHFWLWLLACVALAFVVRLVYVLLLHWDVPPGGDSAWYHGMANLLPKRVGYIDPTIYDFSGYRIEAGDHPPLFPALLAITSSLGGTSWHWHQLVTVFMGACASITIGLAGREVGGARVGIVAALLAAVNPAMWIVDGLVLSESMAGFCIGGVVWAACRAARQPDRGRCIVLGVSLGLTMLVRPEVGMASPLIAIGALWSRREWRRSLVRIATAAITAVALISPWVAFNFSRFDHPVFLSNGLGYTMAVATCDSAFYTERIGFWDLDCAFDRGYPPEEQSEAELFYRRLAVDYLKSHYHRIPRVVVVRAGRAWALYRPLQTVSYNVYEGQPPSPTRAAIWSSYALYPLAIAGIVLARRRRLSPLIFLGVPIAVTVSAMVTFGNTRYRVPADAVVVLAAALAVVALTSRAARRTLWQPRAASAPVTPPTQQTPEP
jgi:4-amino-4-deoxy-L-arabinose transferase-like glycosyltransferase